MEELNAVTTTDVVCWFSVKCYGNPDPGENENPTLWRSTILFWKKAISYFHPNKHIAWNNVSLSGNPTRSQHVSQFLKRLAQKEVRCQGAPPQARQATTKAEFCLMQTLLKDEEVSFEAKYGIRAFNNYQFHMIGRVDDCTQLQLESVQSNQNFPSFCNQNKVKLVKKCAGRTGFPLASSVWRKRSAVLHPDISCPLA